MESHRILYGRRNYGTVPVGAAPERIQKQSVPESSEDTAYEIRQGFKKIYEIDEIRGVLFCRVNGEKKEYFELELR